MDKHRFSFRGLFMVEATILVVGFTATSNFVLRTFYGFVYMNVRLNVPEFPQDKKQINRIR